MGSFFEAIGEKIVDQTVGNVAEHIKKKRAPRRQIAQAILRIREAIIRCQLAYEEYLQKPETIDDYYETIGQLIRSLYLVQNILPIIDPKLATIISDYMGDEVNTYRYPLISPEEAKEELLGEQMMKASPNEKEPLRKELIALRDKMYEKERMNRKPRGKASQYAKFRELAEKDKERFRTIARSWGATGQTPEFEVVINEINQFLSKNFTLDDMW
jgi:hypothetical protein